MIDSKTLISTHPLGGTHVFARWMLRSNAVPITRSSWFHLPRSQSRLDQEMTRLAGPDWSQVL